MPIDIADPANWKELNDDLRKTADKIIKHTIRENTQKMGKKGQDPIIVSLNSYNVTMHYVSALMEQVIGQCLDLQANYEQDNK